MGQIISSLSTGTSTTVQEALKIYDDDNNSNENRDNDEEWVIASSPPDFDELRTIIGLSFSGTETIPGEPMLTWCANHMLKCGWYTQRMHIELTTFMLGIPVYSAIQTHGSQAMVIYKRKKDTSMAEEGQQKTKIDHEKEEETTDDKADIKDIEKKQSQIISAAVIREYNKDDIDKIYKNLMSNYYYVYVPIIKQIIQYGIPEAFKNNDNQEATARYMSKMQKIDKATQPRHKEFAVFLAEQETPARQTLKHWYVQIVAIDPSYNRKGYGTEIMNQINKLADEVGVVCYLECSSDIHRKYYEKFGYEVYKTATIEEDEDCIRKDKHAEEDDKSVTSDRKDGDSGDSNATGSNDDKTTDVTTKHSSKEVTNEKKMSPPLTMHLMTRQPAKKNS